MEILQVVPSLAPAINGVGDYAFLLGRQLRAAHGIHSRFLVCDPTWNGPAELDGFPVDRLVARTASEMKRRLASSGSPQTVLLHYVGYGYEKRGCPIWLVQALRSWVNSRNSLPTQNSPSPRLVTMFHELYAFGPPWRSSFWTSPLQRWITQQIANLSDSCHTNTKRFSDILRRLVPKRVETIQVFPVFSNVGAVKEPLALTQRKSQIAVFGGVAGRQTVYRIHSAALVRLCRVLNIEKVVDIGLPTGVRVNLSVPILEMGAQPAEVVSQVLSESRAGFLSYFADSLAKSGVFAACCAHGQLPVLATRCESEADGLRAGIEYLSACALPGDVSGECAQRIANNAHEWYQKHAVEPTAESFAGSLKGGAM